MSAAEMTNTPRKRPLEPKSGTALTLGPGRFGPVGYAGGVIIEGFLCGGRVPAGPAGGTAPRCVRPAVLALLSCAIRGRHGHAHAVAQGR